MMAGSLGHGPCVVSKPPRPATFDFPLEPTSLVGCKGMNDQPKSRYWFPFIHLYAVLAGPRCIKLQTRVHSLYLFGSRSIVGHQHSPKASRNRAECKSLHLLKSARTRTRSSHFDSKNT